MSSFFEFVSRAFHITKLHRILFITVTPVNNHHINQLMTRSHHKIKSSTDLSHHIQANDIDHHPHHRLMQNGSLDSRQYPYPPYNRYKAFNGLSSEFELSTDTDDDSLIGEADSSNHMPALDSAAEILKDINQKDRDKVLAIIKMLLTENLQLNVKNAKLMQELLRKETEMVDMMRQLRRSSDSYSASNRSDSSINCNGISPRHTSDKYNGDTIKIIESAALRKEVPTADERKDIVNAMPAIKTDSVTIHMIDSLTAKVEKAAHDYSKTDAPVTITVTKTNSVAAPTVIEVGNARSADKVTHNGSNTTILSTKFSGKNETEVIRMPLKKSVCRNISEDAATTTVVVMKPQLDGKTCAAEKEPRAPVASTPTPTPPPPPPPAPSATDAARE